MFVLPVAAVLLAACAADELAGQQGVNPPPAGGAVTGGTVSFTNNTAMTIGSRSDFAAQLPAAAPVVLRAASLQAEDNEACTLSMPAMPEPAADAVTADWGNIDALVAGGKAVVIPAGMQCGLGPIDQKGEPAVLKGDVFVSGTLTVTDFTGGGGRIVVLSGGKLIITGDHKATGNRQPLLSDLSVLCYDGGTLTLYADADLGPNGSLMVEGDLNIYDKGITLGAGSKFYAGGSLTCTGLETTGDGALLHVGGDLKTNAADNEVLKLQHPADVCVEGTMTVWNLDVTAAAHIHVDCRLIARQGVNLDGGGEICASYIETPDFNICQNKHDAPSKVWMTDGGVINVSGNLDIGSPSAFFGIYDKTEASKALIDTENISASSGVKDLTGVVDPAYYINYVNATNIAAFPSPERVNAPGVSINTGGSTCNPGFTVPDPDEPDTPDPGTDPDDPEPEPEPTTGGEIEIPIKIDDIINEDYILKADDFAIRVNGEYMDDIKIEGDNSAKLDGVKIVNDALTIIINGLVDNPAIIEGNDYTYECWIWVENKSLLNDGTGGYGPLFDYDMYEDWANPEGDPDTEDPYGYDMTKRISESGKVKSPAGFVVRYNVYRGLAGRMDTDGHGDTPYIKVSVSVQKDPDARENTNVGIWPAAYNN